MFLFFLKLYAARERSCAVSESLFISFSVSVSYEAIENFNLTRVSLLSLWSASSRPFNTFQTIFLLSVTVKCLMPLIPDESKRDSSLFGEMFKILHQWVRPWSHLSLFEIMNKYFLPGITFSNITNLFTLSQGSTLRKFLLMSSLFIS